MGLRKKLLAETLGTAWLVLGGCGAAVFAAAFPELGIGFMGVSLAFGLSVLTAAYAFGHISGAHFNPAVTLGVLASGQIAGKDALGYIVAQVIGALLGAWAIYAIASGKAGFDVTAGFASNGYGEHSPGGYNMHAAFLAEALLTFFFVFIILHTTSPRAPAGFAPLSIGLSLTLIHLISIPITNTSVNPARSTSQALFQGGWAFDQLWLFWVAPVVGAVIAGLICRFLMCETVCCGGPKSKGEGCCGGHSHGHDHHHH